MDRSPPLWQRLSQDPLFRGRLAESGWTINALAKAHDVAFGTAQLARKAVMAEANPLSAGAEAPIPLSPGESETRTAKGDNLEVLLPACQRQVRTLADLFLACDVDADEWECTTWTAKAYSAWVKNADGEIESKQLYAVKATFKARRLVQTVREVVTRLLDEARERAPQYAPLVHVAPATGRFLHEFAAYDIHLGKLAWSEETGSASYDLDIATNLVDEALEALIQRCEAYPPERILFPIGHDLLHVDGSHNQTTRGTPQDVDGRFKRTFRRTVELLRRWTERLSSIAPVDLVGVPGNHDRESAWSVMEVVSALFEGHQHVSVNNSPRLRKYYTYGNVLLLLTHGSEEKPRHRLSEIAAAEAPVEWGASRTREAHVGHIHQFSLQERHGFRVRVLPSLCPPDQWHAASGWVGNNRSAVALVWSQRDGLAAELHYNVPLVEQGTLGL